VQLGINYQSQPQKVTFDVDTEIDETLLSLGTGMQDLPDGTQNSQLKSPYHSMYVLIKYPKPEECNIYSSLDLEEL
jgi:hypothetical protein